MKGQVKITVKNPQGEIVKEVEQNNRVFDIPKIVMTEMFPMSIQNFYKYSTTDSLPSVSAFPIFNFIPNIKDWFRSIKINDERFEEDNQGNIVDSAYKDWKIPQLCGGENNTLANPSNLRYVAYNTAYSSENDNIKKLYYTWSNCPAFTMRSINLCHYDSIARNNGQSYCNQAICSYGTVSSTNLNFKYGSFYFGYDYLLKSLNYSGTGVYFGTTLFKNPLYKWSNRQFNYTRHLQVGSDYSTNNINIYPLYNNEICLLRNIQDVTTNNSSGYAKYISIIDNETGNLKRQYYFTQFQDIGVCGYSTTSDENKKSSTPTNMNIVSTPTKNYLIQYSPYKYNAYSSSDTKSVRTRVWEIPSQSYEDEHPNVFPVACVGTRSQDSSVVEGKEYYTRNTSNYQGRIPGEYVDESGFLYELVTEPSGNPYSKQYYEIVKGTDGTQIPYIELQGDASVISDFESITSSYYITQSYPINNKFIYGRYILTFKDEGVSIVDRYICNTYPITNASGGIGFNRMLGRTNIPGVQYGLSNVGGMNSIVFPVWYNTACMNLDEDIEIPEGYTLTVEYTITAN